MGRITKRKQALMEDTKNEMRKKISFTKAMTQIDRCEQELIESCKDITSARVSALRAVMDSNWKKIDKFLPNATVNREDHSSNIQIIVNRNDATI